MIDTALLFLVFTVALALLVMIVCVPSNTRSANARARGRVGLHQIRRSRELAELRHAVRRDGQQLRRALDRDFDNLDREER